MDQAAARGEHVSDTRRQLELDFRPIKEPLKLRFVVCLRSCVVNILDGVHVSRKYLFILQRARKKLKRRCVADDIGVKGVIALAVVWLCLMHWPYPFPKRYRRFLLLASDRTIACRQAGAVRKALDLRGAEQFR